MKSGASEEKEGGQANEVEDGGAVNLIHRLGQPTTILKIVTGQTILSLPSVRTNSCYLLATIHRIRITSNRQFQHLTQLTRVQNPPPASITSITSLAILVSAIPLHHHQQRFDRASKYQRWVSLQEALQHWGRAAT